MSNGLAFSELQSPHQRLHLMLWHYVTVIDVACSMAYSTTRQVEWPWRPSVRFQLAVSPTALYCSCGHYLSQGRQNHPQALLINYNMQFCNMAVDQKKGFS